MPKRQSQRQRRSQRRQRQRAGGIATHAFEFGTGGDVPQVPVSQMNSRTNIGDLSNMKGGSAAEGGALDANAVAQKLISSILGGQGAAAPLTAPAASAAGPTPAPPVAAAQTGGRRRKSKSSKSSKRHRHSSRRNSRRRSQRGGCGGSCSSAGPMPVEANIHGASSMIGGARSRRRNQRAGFLGALSTAIVPFGLLAAQQTYKKGSIKNKNVF